MTVHSDNDNARDRDVGDTADSVVASGGPAAIARVSDQGVQAQLPDTGREAPSHATARTVLVSAGSDGKSDAQIAATPIGYVVAWLAIDDGNSTIKLRGVSADGALFGKELTVGLQGRNNHDLSIDGHAFAPGPRQPAGGGRAGDLHDAGIVVSWTESLAGDASGVGRIMAARYRVVLDDRGEPTDLAPADFHLRSFVAEVSSGAAAAADNDNAIWVGDDGDHGVSGAVGSNPTIAGLVAGDTLVGWIDPDNRVHARLFPRLGDAASTSPAAANQARDDYAQINAALTDLGEAAQPDNATRRLHSVELAPGNFAIMWVVLGATGLQLSGYAFSRTHGAPDESESTAAWISVPVGPVILPPSATGELSLYSGEGGSHLVVASPHAINASGAIEALRLHIDVPSERPARQETQTGQLEDGSRGPSGLREVDNSAIDHAAVLSAQPATALVANAVQQPVFDDVFSIASSSVDEFAPILSATRNALIVGWQTPGTDPGRATLNLAMFDTHGGTAPRMAGAGSVIEVTHNADSHVAPAIAGLGAGAIAVWVDADTHALTARVLDGDDDASEPVEEILVSAEGAFSDIAVASLAEPASAHFGEDAKPDSTTRSEGQVAIAWVEDAEESGYGNIMLQLYGSLEDDDGHGPSLVALGGDGRSDGEDRPTQVTVVSGTEVTTVEGRSPVAVGLGDGQFALIWVESSTSGEHISGKVIDAEDGHQVLVINPQMDGAGLIERGTKPALSDLGEQGFLVSWLQPDGDSFDLVAAHYRPVGADAWLPPDNVIRLQHFDREPEEFSVVAAGDETISLVVTWRADGKGSSHDVQGQRFDLLGNPIGEIFEVAGGDQQSADGTSVSVGLPDGRIVVVLTEESRDGDRDVVAHVLDAGKTVDGSAAAGGAGEQASGQASIAAASAIVFPPATKSVVVAAIDPTDGVAIEIFPGGPATYSITAINGMSVEAPADATALAAPVRVAEGFVQLRGDGQLVFSPDVTFEGSATFGCTLADLGSDEEVGTIDVSIVNGSLARGSAPIVDGDAPQGHGSAPPSNFGDTLFFGEAIGKGVRTSDRHVVDLSTSGYETFEALRDAGALAQVGDDVVITLSPDDPFSDTVTLKSMTLDSLDAGGFKFS